jgi:aldose 1-epimerase
MAAMTAPDEPSGIAEPDSRRDSGRPTSVRPILLTGAQHDIGAGDYEATATELGAGLRRLTFRGKSLITGYEADELPPGGAGQLLAPWPNRIDGGRYEFGGGSFQLDLSEPARGNAIHGLTRWANWDLADRAASDQVTLSQFLHGRPGYPFCLALSVTYRLGATSGLAVAVTAWNVGSRPAPYGTGSHPYVTAGAPLVNDCELELPAGYWLPTDDRGIPSGPAEEVAGTEFDFRVARRIGETRLDHALTGLTRDESGLAWARLSSESASVGLWAGPGYDWLQVFTGDPLDSSHRRRALAIEPMTCPANAFVTGDGLLTLDPGDSVTHTWGIHVIED